METRFNTGLCRLAAAVFALTALNQAGATSASLSKPNDVAVNRVWAERAFSAKPMPAKAGNTLTIVREDDPGETKAGMCAIGWPIKLRNSKVYQHGIGVNSVSVIRISLEKQAARFQADIGFDRSMELPGSMTFHVRVDGKDLFATDVIRDLKFVQSIDVPLNGAKTFELVVGDGGDNRGYDRADWADARVVMEDGSRIWLDDLGTQWSVGTDLPFSFVYGGKASSELIGGWRREGTDEKLDMNRLRRTVTLTDPNTGLEVKAVAMIYTDTPGVDWTLYFTNTGSKDTPIIEEVKALDVNISPGIGGTPKLHRTRGSAIASSDWEPLDSILAPGTRVDFAPDGGRSSAGLSPFFDVQWDKGGVVTAIGWSGQWTASVEQTKARELRIRAGMQHMRLSLRPGESIRGPRILQVYWSGEDQFTGCNIFRQTMLAHIMPRIDGKNVVPPIAILSPLLERDYAEKLDFWNFLYSESEENCMEELALLRGLGFELFWEDAFYTTGNLGWGHWRLPVSLVPDPKRWPRGLRPVSDAAHRDGMKFLVWFEPERVAPNTYLAKEHPEFVISIDGDGSGLFNLGNPEARKYMTDFLLSAIKEWGMDWFRTDHSLPGLASWQFADKANPDRLGISEIRYVEGLYKMWDDLRSVYPHLAIDNCAGGGTRIDLETCSRSIPLWRTDSIIGAESRFDYKQVALENQSMSIGLNRYLPFSMAGQIGVSPYCFRSGFNSGFALLEKPYKEYLPLLKQGIAEGKRIRKYYFGDFYPLTSIGLSTRDWVAMQYHRPGEGDGMVIAFRRHNCPYGSYFCELREIDPAAKYVVTQYHSYEPSKPVTMHGSDLMKIRAEIDECPGSVLIEYRRIGK